MHQRLLNIILNCIFWPFINEFGIWREMALRGPMFLASSFNKFPLRLNILVDRLYNAKICDLGLSQFGRLRFATFVGGYRLRWQYACFCHFLSKTCFLQNPLYTAKYHLTKQTDCKVNGKAYLPESSRITTLQSVWAHRHPYSIYSILLRKQSNFVITCGTEIYRAARPFIRRECNSLTF